MKKNILTVSALLAFAALQAQIQINNGTNSTITNSNVILDASTSFSTEAGAGPNVGKGIIIPAVDLVNFEFDLTLADGSTFPTYFDGMIVYNKATGTTLTTGNRPSTALVVTPGFYYFSNPNGAANGNVTGGQWKPMGGTAAGDNLGNHSATQNLALNSYELRLKGAGDNNQSLVYNSTVDGPRLFGAGGGYLGTANGTNALTWDSNGNVTSPGIIKAGLSGGFTRLVSGNTTNSGYIDFFKSDGSTRLGYIGFDNTNLTYVADNGASHYFSGEIYSGLNQWFRVRGNKGLYWQDYGGGFYMDDNNTIKVTNNKNIYTGGSIRSGISNGYIRINPGSSSTSGFMEVIKSDGTTRLGYIGFDNTNMSYVAENGASHYFSGEIYSGTNQWFRVRGNTGLYWQDHGGGLYMDDDNSIKVSNNKNIYTGGQIRSGNSGGYIRLNPGGSSTSGYMEIIKSDASTRLGYIGFDNYNVTYNAENGAIHIFNTTIQTPRVQGPSDRRFKKDITPIYNATEKLNQLNGYTYTWKDKKEFPGQTLGEGKDMGVIAQEVENVFPDAVITNKEGYKSVNYNALIPVLIEALKESNRKIKALEDRLNGSSSTDRASGIPAAAKDIR